MAAGDDFEKKDGVGSMPATTPHDTTPDELERILQSSAVTLDPLQSTNLEFMDKLEQQYPDAFIITADTEEGKVLTIAPVYPALTKSRPNEYPQEMISEMERMARLVRGFEVYNVAMQAENIEFEKFALKASVDKPATMIKFSRNGIKYPNSLDDREICIPDGLMGLGDNDQKRLKALIELAQLINHFEKVNYSKTRVNQNWGFN